MDRLPTRIVERIYDALCKYAEANPNYYERESFIYHFGVKKGMTRYQLNCIDHRPRTITFDESGMTLKGKGSGMVNSIIFRLISDVNI